MISQKKFGLFFGYLSLILSSFFSIFFTPFLIKSLGMAEYGLFQLVSSFSSYLVLLNFGTSTITTRFIAKFRLSNSYDDQSNFLFISLLITFCLMIITGFFGFLLFLNIDYIFKSSLSHKEIDLVRKLFVISLTNISLHLFTGFFNGIINGYEKFFLSKGYKVLNIFLRVLFLYVLLSLGFKTITILLTDLLINLIILVHQYYYCFFILKIKIVFKYWDKILFKQIFLFSFAITLQSIINQVNQNVDRTILGIMTNPSTVAIYSIALLFFTLYNNVSSIIGTFFLPSAVRLISNRPTKEQLTEFIVRPGRLQFMIAGVALSGFFLFGKNFLMLWLGRDFIDVYLLCLILLPPITIPLVQNVCNAILDAMMIRHVRSVILLIIATLNVVLTIFLVNKMGFVGAAIATSIAITIGHVVIMNYYYFKYIGLDVIGMFKGILNGTFLCLLISTIVFYPFAKSISLSWYHFFLKCFIYVIFYFFLLNFLSFNEYEKKLIQKPFLRVIKLTIKYVIKKLQ